MFGVCLVLSGSVPVRAQMEEWRRETPDLIAHGKALYQVHCLICHGAGGRGDGPAGVAFNPPPRDFVAAKWQQGGSPSELFRTLSKGLGSMPGFATLPLKDRWALVHYIRTFNSQKQPDTAGTIALLEEFMPRKEGAVRELPVEFIMERMAAEARK